MWLAWLDMDVGLGVLLNWLLGVKWDGHTFTVPRGGLVWYWGCLLTWAASED